LDHFASCAAVPARPRRSPAGRPGFGVQVGAARRLIARDHVHVKVKDALERDRPARVEQVDAVRRQALLHARASLCEATATALRSSPLDAQQVRGMRARTTSAWPRVAGAMSMNASVRSSSSTTERADPGDDLAEDAVLVRHRAPGAYSEGAIGPRLGGLRAYSSASSRVCTSPAYCGLGDLSSSVPTMGPAASCSSPVTRRRERAAAGLPRGASAGRPRAGRARAQGALRSKLRALAACRQPVGHREQRDIDLDGLTCAQVLVDRAPRERLGSVDEEAEPKVWRTSAATCACSALRRAAAAAAASSSRRRARRAR